MRRLIGLGAGGHARVVMEAFQAMGGFEVIGLLDLRAELRGTRVGGVPVLGGDGELPRLRAEGVMDAFIGIGSVGDAGPRRRAFERARAAGFRIAGVVHPSAVLSPSALIGEGVQVLPGAVINAGARLGENIIVNTGAIVEHDCLIGSHAHIASGARLASTVTVGEGAHIGLGASVRQLARIGRDAIVGAGAVVVDDVPDGVTVVGVPARALRGAAV